MIIVPRSQTTGPARMSVSKGRRSSKWASAASSAFYTPFPIAVRLVKYADGSRIMARVVDPACGDGSLLLAASSRWPRAVLVGNDVRRAAIRGMRAKCRSCSTSQHDFLVAVKSRASLERLRRQWRPDLVLLNPPFNSRARHRHKVVVGAELVAKVSQAAAFLLGSAQLLAAGGQMVAVMPLSFLNSDRDRMARRLLAMLGEIEVLEELPHNVFPGCNAATLLLRFTRAEPVNSSSFESPRAGRASVQTQIEAKVVRGNVPVHSVDTNSKRLRSRFMHTTGLQAGRAKPILAKLGAIRSPRSVRGHLVLIPRVGKPDVAKITLCNFPHAIVLSDCLFAVVCRDADSASLAFRRLLANWTRLEKSFAATGAPHLTAARLTALLTQIGLADSLKLQA
jgi:predicted RNA methylase